MDKYNSRSAVVFFIFWIAVLCILPAQTSGKWLLKPDFLALLHSSPTLQTRLEHKLLPKSSMQVATGFCFGASYMVYQDPADSPEYDAAYLKGFSLRAEYRHYLQDSGTTLQGIYVAPEIGYKYVTYQQAQFFYVTTFDNTFYQRLIEYNVRKNTYMYHLKIGYQQKITSRMYVDVFGGVGRRIVTLKNNIQMPDDAKYMEEVASFGTHYWGYKGTKTKFSVAGSVLLGFIF